MAQTIDLIVAITCSKLGWCSILMTMVSDVPVECQDQLSAIGLDTSDGETIGLHPHASQWNWEKAQRLSNCQLVARLVLQIPTMHFRLPAEMT